MYFNNIILLVFVLYTHIQLCMIFVLKISNQLSTTVKEKFNIFRYEKRKTGGSRPSAEPAAIFCILPTEARHWRRNGGNRCVWREGRGGAQRQPLGFPTKQGKSCRRVSLPNRRFALHFDNRRALSVPFCSHMWIFLYFTSDHVIILRILLNSGIHLDRH